MRRVHIEVPADACFGPATRLYLSVVAAESIQSGRSVLEVAMESTEIAEDQLRELPDARRLTGGGRDMSSRPHT